VERGSGAQHPKTAMSEKKHLGKKNLYRIL
jgi:hypothetical protein